MEASYIDFIRPGAMYEPVIYNVCRHGCRTEQLLAQGSPERLAANGHELALFGHALDNAHHPHLSNVSNNLVSGPLSNQPLIVLNVFLNKKF